MERKTNNYSQNYGGFKMTNYEIEERYYDAITNFFKRCRQSSLDKYCSLTHVEYKEYICYKVPYKYIKEVYLAYRKMKEFEMDSDSMEFKMVYYFVPDDCTKDDTVIFEIVDSFDSTLLSMDITNEKKFDINDAMQVLNQFVIESKELGLEELYLM